MNKSTMIEHWELRGEEKTGLNCISDEPREQQACLSPASLETPQIGPHLKLPDKHAHTQIHQQRAHAYSNPQLWPN